MKKAALFLLVLLIVISFFGCSSSTSSTTVRATAKSTTVAQAPTSAPPVSSSPAAPSTTSAPAANTSPSAPASPTGTPIKIGAIISLTGGSAASGAGQKLELQYRLNQIGNQVAGRPIQLVMEDDASSPTTSVDVIKKLTLLDKVDVILGPTQGGAAVAAANYMKTFTTATPIFIIMAKPGVVLQNVPNQNIYLPMGTDAATGYYLGLYAADKLKYQTATLMFEDMVSGYDKVQNGFLAAFQKQGGSAIQQQAIKSDTVDFSPFIAGLKPADCAVYWSTPGMASRFPVQYIASGKTIPLLMPDSTVLLSQTLTLIGEKAAGIVSETNYTSLIDTPLNQAYVADFQAKMGVIPQPQAAGMDMALLVFLEAVKATNGDVSPAKINEAIHKVKMDTPAGTISFTPQGMGIGDLYLAQSVKLADRVDWKPLDKYSQVVLDIPAPTPAK
jgi:branched-chain amino acid transport system substrate-binding protein